MTVPRAYLREMKAKHARLKRRQEWEASGHTDLLRLDLIAERYEDADDPMRLFIAQMQEVIRRHAIEAGMCEGCIAKLPDPLA